ncbi:MAG: hypothetical protein VKO65_09120 [Cyanobacteriota bacterium]|nr:hypothetical protein [Cyanobacteriota bacterium]
MSSAHASFGGWNPLGSPMTSLIGESAPEESWDAVESYFECITTCSLEDGECVTRCVEVLRQQG